MEGEITLQNWVKSTLIIHTLHPTLAFLNTHLKPFLYNMPNKNLGGEITKNDAQTFSDEFSNYLKSVDPAQYDSIYTGGTGFTAKEVADFIAKIITDNPTVDESDIKLYLCTTILPSQTLNPYTGTKSEKPKFSGCIVAIQSPGQLIPEGSNKVSISDNPYYLGSYNWGDMSP